MITYLPNHEILLKDVFSMFGAFVYKSAKII